MRSGPKIKPINPNNLNPTNYTQHGYQRVHIANFFHEAKPGNIIHITRNNNTVDCESGCCPGLIGGI